MIGCLRAAQKAAIGCQEGLGLAAQEALGEPPGGLTPISSSYAINAYKFKVLDCVKGV